MEIKTASLEQSDTKAVQKLKDQDGNRDDDDDDNDKDPALRLCWIVKNEFTWVRLDLLSTK